MADIIENLRKIGDVLKYVEAPGDDGVPKLKSQTSLKVKSSDYDHSAL